MNSLRKASLLVITVILSLFFGVAIGQVEQVEKKPLIGTYYFDGWTGKTSHLNDYLRDSFPERKPIWGWVTSTPLVMEAQIDSASSAGIDFFSFCWYYSKKTGGDSSDPKNNAVQLFRRSPNKSRMKFNLLIANHPPYQLGRSSWEDINRRWINYFKDSTYLCMDDKPVIIFFDLNNLIDSFGSEDQLKAAFRQLRSEAGRNGFKGLEIGVCLSPDTAAAGKAFRSGFDFLTGYNYHNAGITVRGRRIIPVDSLRAGEERVWNRFLQFTLPFFPVTTLNWDPRPASAKYRDAPWFTGFSESSVDASVHNLLNWVYKQRKKTKIPVALLYAWNEYGEGAWLTPSEDRNMLNGLKAALKPDEKNK